MRRVVQLVQPHRPKAATVAWEAPGAGQSKSPIGPLRGLTPEQRSSGHWSNRLSTATPQQGCTKEGIWGAHWDHCAGCQQPRAHWQSHWAIGENQTH